MGAPVAPAGQRHAKVCADGAVFTRAERDQGLPEAVPDGNAKKWNSLRQEEPRSHERPFGSIRFRQPGTGTTRPSVPVRGNSASQEVHPLGGFKP